MAGGNVTAMMMCSSFGIIDEDEISPIRYHNFSSPVPVFYSCFATDNTTFSSSHKVCLARNWPPSNCPYDATSTEYITWSDTINNNWILHKIDRQSNSSDKYGAMFRFYEVSSD